MNPVANPHGFKVNDAPLTEREYRLLIRIANKCGYRTFRCQDKDLIHFSDSWSREKLRKGLVALFGHLGLTAYG